jgi:hypothetical protein
MAQEAKVRMTDIDMDNRRHGTNKTDHFCYRCNKDIKPSSKFRMIHVIDGGHMCLHRDDEAAYKTDGGDMYFFPVGMDCAKKIGLEFTHEANR